MPTVTVKVDPQPTWIESSSRWCFEYTHSGVCGMAVTASREWREYVPIDIKPHPDAKAVMKDGVFWYWVYGNDDCDIKCPFCGESDFDKVGLKGHLFYGDCAEYEQTEPPRRLF